MRSPETSAVIPAVIPAAVQGTASTVDSTGPATPRWRRPSVIISGVLFLVIAMCAYLATLIAGSESDTAAATQQMANALADAGIEPAVVAQHVLDAVRESRFYVIPHEQAAIDATESRVEWMRDGRPGKTDMSRALKP